MLLKMKVMTAVVQHRKAIVIHQMKVAKNKKYYVFSYCAIQVSYVDNITGGRGS